MREKCLSFGKQYGFKKIFLLFSFFILLVSVVQAQHATGGSSPYRDDVMWLTWGNGTNGTSGQTLNVGAMASSTVQVAGGADLVIECTINNITHSGGGDTWLESYNPGGWQGDILDDLYNIGGPEGANQLTNGIARSSGITDFTIGCNSTLGGQPYRIKGLVMADAEAINTNTEYVQATAAGTWNVVEMSQNIGAGSYIARKTNNGGTQTIRFGPGTDNETAAVTFLSFNSPSDNVTMDFSIEGGGTTAIAIGLLAPYADFGDAPASYGDAMHLVQDLKFLSDNIPSDGADYDLNQSSYQPGGLASAQSDFIGTQGPDTELNQGYDTDADQDDNGSGDEENAWADNYTITVLQEGEILQESIACTGSGTVAAWIDFDQNGIFDTDERAESACSGGNADLSWSIPANLSPGKTYVRLRYSTNSTEITSPTGTAKSGEVEDHAITITAPQLSVTKSNNATGGSWDVDESNTEYTLTVTNNGGVATGDPANGISPDQVIVRDELPAGIEAGWSGTYTNNGWSCTFSGQEINCTSSDLIAASGQSGDQSIIQLPVTLTEDAIGNATNYASVGGGRDPDYPDSAPVPGSSCADGEHCASNSVTVEQAPELTLDKTLTDSPTTIVEGSELEYTITATNSGNVSIDHVKIIDPDLTPTEKDCATLDLGDDCTLTGTYTVSASDVNAGEVVNTANVSGDDPNANVINDDDQLTTPIPLADLEVTKFVNNATPYVGKDVTFTIEVVNNGTDEATNVSINDQLPSGYAFESASPSQGNYNDNTGQWTVGSIPNGATESLNITATVQTSGNYQNTASVGSVDQEDPTPGNNDETTSTNPTPSADVQLTKTLDTSGPFKVGQQLNYIITVSNDGPSEATNIEVTDTPTNITITNVSGSGCSSFPCTISSLANGATATINVTATIDAAGPFDNTAAANADEYDPDTGNDNDDTGNGGTADPESDLAITKTVTPNAPSVGKEVTFTLMATNDGPSEATNVTVQDPLPAGYDFVSANTATGTYDESTGTWMIGTIADGGSTDLTITAEVLPSGPYDNSASITGDADDPDPDNNTGNAEPNPVPSADLSIDKTLDTMGPFYVGQQVEYTITVTNDGPSEAQNVEITETPDNLSITDISGVSCTSFPCTIPTLASGTQQAITVMATIDGTGSFSNDVAVSSDTDDPNSGDNGDNDPGNGGSADPSADIEISKTVSNVTPSVGDDVTFTIEAINNGPSNATNVSVSDPLPGGYQFVSSSAGQGSYDSSTGLWTIGNMADGTTTSLDITAAVEPSGPYTNTASVNNSDQHDPDGGNNNSTSNPSPSPSADVQLTKTLDTGGPFVAGQQVDYTITVSNGGPSEATNIEVTDTPTNITITNVSGSGCSSFPCTISNLASGNNTTISVIGTINQEGAFGNTATAEADEDDPNSSNNTGNDGDSGDASADISVTKTLGTAAPYKAGQEVSYSITVSNNGPSDATGILVEENLTNLTITDVSGGGCSSFPCTIPQLTDGGQATITVKANIDAAGSFENEVSANPTENDPDGNNNTDTDGGSADPAADISIDKTLDTAGPYGVGQEVDYTITVTNDGPSEAQNVEITETPMNLTIADVSGAGCSSFPCTIADMPSGEQQVVTVVATIDGAGAFSNDVAVSSDIDDPNPNNDGDNDPGNGGNASTSADLTIDKSLQTAGPYNAGQEVEYTITVTNDGPSEAQNIEVTESPTNLTIADVSGAGCSSFPCTISNMISGEQQVISVVATIDGQGAFDNKAAVSSDTDDPNSGDNTDNDPGNGGDADPSAGVSINKILDTPGPYNAGQEVEYTITVTNDGPSEAQNVEVTESPTNLTITEVSGAGCSSFPCNIPTVNANEQKVISVVATIDGQGTFANDAAVSTDTDDPDSGDNSDNDPQNGGTAGKSADLLVNKILDTPGPYNAGQEVEYTITITNDGPSEAQNVEVADTPENLTITGINGAGCNSFPCSIDRLAANEKATISVAATIDGAGAFSNDVAVSSDTDDPNSNNDGDDDPQNGGNADPSANLSIDKTLDTDGPYGVGQEVDYTIRVTNDGPSEAQNVEVTDTPENLTITEVNGAGCSSFPCNIDQLADNEEATISVVATIDGEGDFGNVASVSSATNDPVSDDDSDDDSDNGANAKIMSNLVLEKQLVDGGPYIVGQKVDYNIKTLNKGPSDVPELEITDTPQNLIITDVEGAGCTTMPCTITDPLSAEEEIVVTVTAEIESEGTFDNEASVTSTADEINLSDNSDNVVSKSAAQVPSLRITKQASNLTARSGGFVPYTITINNLEEVPVNDVQIMDSPAPGLSYVDQSLGVNDVDNSGGVGGLRPMIINDIDVPAGGQATVSYVMRVGATALPGELQNTAYATKDGTIISGESETSVMLEGDPIMDDTRILGTVFRDHDRDGWQDKATATELFVKGGFKSDTYIAGSTTINRGDGPKTIPDGSAPLLNGISLGTLAGRQSITTDSVDKVVVSQRLNEADFTDDFVLRSAEGSYLQMTATGEIKRTPKGAVERGTNAQKLIVERNIEELANGEYRLDYIIANKGFNDWGLPGARLATPRGLVIETDGYGRYHIEAIDAGSWRRGRNYVVKVDDSSLPPNRIYTTENPLVRRVTQGLPVRFDFGIHWPSADVAVTKKLRTEGPYTPGQSVEYSLHVMNNGPTPATDIRMADKATNLSITDVSGAGCSSFPCTIPGPLEIGEERLLRVEATIDSAETFKNKADAWPSQQDPLPDNNVDQVVDTAEIAEDPVACRGDAALPKSVHFETDEAEINTESAALLDKVAGYLVKQSECSLAITGHTDHDLNHEYNLALSERRAEAIVAYLESAGVPSDRIENKGVSFDEPAINEGDILDKARNRRVSFSLHPENSELKLVEQIEDLQVDPEPESWDYVFDFRHNAVPAQLHLATNSAGLNFVNRYLLKRIGFALEKQKGVSATFHIPKTANDSLNAQRAETIEQTLATTGVPSDKYVVNIDSVSTVDQNSVRISYAPYHELDIVSQEDDIRLAGEEAYRPLLDKAWKMLNNRNDASLLQEQAALQIQTMSASVGVGKEATALGHKAEAVLSRLSSYLHEHQLISIELFGRTSMKDKLEEAQIFLEEQGIAGDRIAIKPQSDSDLPDNLIRIVKIKQ